MYKYISILILFLLVGCTPSSDNKLKDASAKATYIVKYEVLNTLADVNARYAEVWSTQTTKPILEFERGERWAFTYQWNDICIIVRAKADQYTLKEFEKTIGHEHLHCIYGAWHK